MAAPVLLVFALAGCGGPAPRPLVLGRDVCEHCHMTLADRRFAAELVLRTGKVVPFDDPGCLAAGAAATAADLIQSLWVADYLVPDSISIVDRMVFIRSDSIRTPMGYGIIAVRPGPAADSLARRIGSPTIGWADVVALVQAAPR